MIFMFINYIVSTHGRSDKTEDSLEMNWKKRRQEILNSLQKIQGKEEIKVEEEKEKEEE